MGRWAKRGSGGDAPNTALAEKRQQEEKHFLQCLAFVYDAEQWVSYEGSLYFFPKTEEQLAKLEQMKAEREGYMFLTNRMARHEIATGVLASSGIGETWQKSILLPYSQTNHDLTPTMVRTGRVVATYQVAKNFSGGDAILDDGTDLHFVMGFGRAADDLYRTNAVLIREGVRSFRASSNEWIRLEAFTNAGLSREERSVLRRVASAFRARSEGLAQPGSTGIAVATRTTTNAPARTPSEAEIEFRMHLSRAKDESPYMQYLVARHYLEGKGTPKDEKLGWEWMRRAAGNGSGDAQAVLEKQGSASRR